MRKLFFAFLLLGVLLTSGCIGNMKTAPEASTAVTHLDTLEFALDPPVSEELLDAINFTDAEFKSVLVSNEGWRFNSKNKGYIERGKDDTVNNSEKEKLRQRDINFTKMGRANYTEPNIFTFYSPSFVLIKQYCDSNRIEGLTDNRTIDPIVLALKNYNCSMSAKVKVFSIKVPRSAYIINKETLAYMKNKGTGLQYYQAAEDGYYTIAFSDGNTSLSVMLTQVKESYLNYTTYVLNTDNEIYQDFIVENKTFKNGNYWSLNVSNTPSNRAKWYCSTNNSTIEIRSDAKNQKPLLSFEDMTELSRFLCPE